VADTRLRTWLALAIVLVFSMPLVAAKTVNLLGFVDKMCPDEPHCFELMVKPEFIAEVGASIKVRFNAATRIYDPENYELTLEQQDIVPGSHLRMLIEENPGGEPDEHQASFIWIGD
jgi:hypothetical protein